MKIAKILAGTLIGILVLAAITMIVSSRNLHRWFDTTISAPPYEISAAARELHDTLLIADMHVDSAVHLVDFSRPQDIGHVGADRLEAGGMSLMTLSLPTEVTVDKWRIVNGMAIGSVVNGQPFATWFSNFSRGNYFREHIERVVAGNPDRMFVIRTRADLRDLVQSWGPGGDRKLGILISVEGIHILDNQIGNLQPLIDSGIRMISLTHGFDNEAAGSNTGAGQGGLTEYGREVLRIMQDNNVILDLAHLSDRATHEALDIVSEPVVISHTGVRATCNKGRNVSDEVIRRIGENGGVIGVGFFRNVLCGDDLASIVRAMNHIRDLAGIEHVAIGSDYDGAVTVVFDAGGLPLLTDALISDGYTEDEIRMVMGGNTLRVLSQVLPGVHRDRDQPAASAGPRG
ncbi:MAG: dipeptidase [Gammaproteobacteria bacterium]